MEFLIIIQLKERTNIKMKLEYNLEGIEKN